jgi:diguanylate cyclase (GGDEF)-like protein
VFGTGRADGPRPTAWIRLWGAANSSPVAGGRALLLANALIVAVSLPLLHPDRRQWLTAGVLFLLTAAFLGVSAALPWQRWPRSASLAFPVALLAALGALGWSGSTMGSAYRGLIVFAFMYAGLTQAPGTALLMVPPAAGAYLLGVHSWSSANMVRLPIAIAVWVFVGELLAGRTSSQTSMNAKLRHDAYTDILTGVGNRRAFDARLEKASPGDCIVIIDLDDFKMVNDTHGHSAGDAVLASFGQLLTASLRGDDFAARYGGEEFVAVLYDTAPESALDVLSRMRRRWRSGGAEVTFSSGVAVISDSQPAQTAFAVADEALYASKRGGRNCDHISYHQIVRAGG